MTPEAANPPKRRFASRFSLLALVIAAGIVPPVLALLWFLATVVANEYWTEFDDYLLSATIWTTLALSAYSLLAVRLRAAQPASLPPIRIVALAACQFLAMWFGWYILCALAGWIFLWGDNGPPTPDPTFVFGGISSAAVAAIAALRIGTKTASLFYVRVVTYTTIALAVLSGTVLLLWWTR